MKNKSRVNYQDCITGKVGLPTDYKQKLVFQIMMISCMVVVMVTLNWAIRTPDHSLQNFINSLYMYPLTFSFILAIRLLIINQFIDQLVQYYILPRFQGLKKALGITFINLMIMVPISSFFGVLITHGGLSGFSWHHYVLTIAISYVMGFIVNYFFVSPFIKKVFVENVKPRMV